MSFTYGFYNSMNSDRRYNAEQMAAVFDCLINDGVQMNIGNALVVKATSATRQVAVQTGRAWFNSTWSYNDADYPIVLDAVTTSGYKRIDAICLVVNKANSVRANSLQVVKGSVATSPSKPALNNTDTLFYHPLAYVTVTYGMTTVPAANIENCVGTSACPFITGILQTIDIDQLLSQWDGEFNDWWDTVKATLDTNTVTQLQNQIDHLKVTEEVANKYGFTNKAAGSAGYTYKEYMVDAILSQISILLNQAVTIYSGIDDPASSLGVNGNLYLQY